MSALEGAGNALAERRARRVPGSAADSQAILTGLLRAADAALVPSASFLAYWAWHGHLSLPVVYLVPTLLGTLLTLNFLHLVGAYGREALRRPALQVGRALAAWLIAAGALVVIAYLTSTSLLYSRGWWVLWLLGTMGGLILLRAGAAARLARWRREGLLSTRVALIGTGELAQLVARQLGDAPDQQYRVIGFFHESDGVDCGQRGPGLGDLLAAVRANQVDEVLVALPWTAGGALEGLLRRLNALPVNLRICPDMPLLTRPLRRLPPMAALPTLDLSERPIGGWHQVLKRVEDLTLAPAILLLALPALAAIALAIKLDSPGPVLFRQRRYGFNNNEFTVFKFRTMRDGRAEPGVPQARRGDHRVTRVGAFLRRTSLDELPQLWNVMRGEMSLVGPRPHAVEHNKHFAQVIDDYLGRHRVKPGITGWAQVHGLRGETRSQAQMRLRVQYDLHYIDNWSLWLDLKILLLTIFVGFVHENAY